MFLEEAKEEFLLVLEAAEILCPTHFKALKLLGVLYLE